jgi:L-alanine-DL-glutamate epimerase-like enolase superfamily enzyme
MIQGEPMSDVIHSIRAHAIDLPLLADFVTSKKRYSSLPYVITEATSYSGRRGYGEAREATQITGETTESILGIINKQFAPALKGMNPFDIEAIHAAMNEICFGNTAAKSAVDLCVYDLMGQICQQPVCRLLGGKLKSEVQTSKAIGLGKRDAVLQEAKDLVNQGFSILKLKTGIDPEEEIKMIREIRETIGPDIRLKLDANQGWILREALKVIRAVDFCGIEVVEQPLPVSDLKGSAELRKLIDPPVMLDEGIHSPSDVIQIAESGAADMINIKLIKTGGLYPALAVNAVAEAAGMICQIGSLDTTIGSAAAAHLAMAKNNIRYAEIVGPTRLKKDVAEGLTIVGGMVRIEDGPGYGIKVDPNLLNSSYESGNI